MTTPRPLRPLGRSGLSIPPLVSGGNVFGWTADEKTSFSLLDAWLDAGMNAVDTADVYSRWVGGHSGGESETILGKWFARSGKRDRVVLMSKLGKDMGEGRKGLSRRYIAQAVDASLARLQTDYIDLYQSHDDDADTPLEETLAAYGDLIRAGKVRAIGASNYSASRLQQALILAERTGLPRYESLQPLYNLCDREEFERDLPPLCERDDVGVINFYALASGFLSGKYRSAEDAAKSPRGRGVVQKYLNPRGLRILGALDAVGKRLDATPAQVALAWQIARPGITAPIVSATSIVQLAEVVDASQLQLDVEAIGAIDEASRLGD